MSNGEIPHSDELPKVDQVGADEISTESTTRKVYALTELQEPKVFWSRNTKQEHLAGLFFRALIDTRKVTIIAPEEEITSDSILKVRDRAGIILTLPLSYYLELTEVDPNREITDYHHHVMRSFSRMGISMIMITDDMTRVEMILTDGEIDIYRPENIAGMRDSQEFYTCKVYHDSDTVLAYGEPYGFFTTEISLLDIMLVALHKAQDMDTTTQGVALEVTHYKRGKTVVTIVPNGRVEHLLESALKRKNPIYQNMTFEKAREHYMKTRLKSKFRL